MNKNNLFIIDYSNQVGKDADFVENHVNLFFASLASFCQENQLTSLELSNNIKSIELEISLLNEQDMAELNNSFIGKNKSTNVLSFQNYSNLELLDFKEKDCCLGSIIICYNNLSQEAERAGVDKVAYLYVLLTHGFLHLCGFDHTCEEDAKLMQEKERLILNKFSLGKDLRPLVANYFEE